MVTFIRYVVETFGGRIAGTSAEKQAQEYVKTRLDKYCTGTVVEEFSAALDAHFESLKLFCFLYLMNIGLFWYSPKAALISGLIIMVTFLGHFVGFRPWLDFLYPKKTSWNTSGVIEPEEFPKSTLIIAGHIDSVYEFQWWYKLKQSGAVLTVIACVLIGFQWVAFLAGYLWPLSSLYIIIGLLALAPLLIVLFTMHDKKRPVDGALDNLTGIAIALEMAKTFSAKKLKHTRLRILSFGAEEPGLKGSAAYARKYLDTLKNENAVLINIDTIKDKDKLSIVTAELNAMVFYPKDLIAKLEQSFTAQGVPYSKTPLTIGVTDGAAFRFYGLPALSIVGMDSKTLDPCYHTRLDTPGNLSEEALLALRSVLEDFIRKWDDIQ